MIRHYPAIAILGLALANPAQAADAFSLRPSYGTGHDWSGLYAGAHLGYGWGGATNDWFDSAPEIWKLDGDINYASPAAGVQIGYQQQFDTLVTGIEADLSLARYLGHDARAAGRINEIEINALGSLRGRLGWAADTMLLYGTAGLAIANFHKRDRHGLPNAPQFAAGWVLGGGVEVAVTDSWSLRAEYLHTRLNDVETALSVNEPSFVGTYPHRANAPAINMLRIGANYRF